MSLISRWYFQTRGSPPRPCKLHFPPHRRRKSAATTVAVVFAATTVVTIDREAPPPLRGICLLFKVKYCHEFSTSKKI
ncbi:hypothetical protein Scep_021798 [Stephania cephalantha]|uniref:Uncharacterized protein n=1 Tax=Stephania cephalantha TaxID=152367 RepID=A0AAP0I251_9MAGN